MATNEPKARGSDFPKKAKCMVCVCVSFIRQEVLETRLNVIFQMAAISELMCTARPHRSDEIFNSYVFNGVRNRLCRLSLCLPALSVQCSFVPFSTYSIALE